MAVTETLPIDRYTANGSNDTFSITFDFIDTDVIVYVDGVVSNDYEVVGSTIVFDTAPANLAKITIVGDPTLARVNDYQAIGPYWHTAINGDLDRLWIATQALDLRIGHGIRFDPSAVASNADLTLSEDATDRAYKLIGFDVNGDATLYANPDVDPTLTAIGNLSTAADKLAYFTGVDTAALTDFTAFARTLLDDSDAATARTTLGLGTMAVQDSSNITVTGGSITGITDLAVADGGTGASDAATARTNLGLVIGTDVQAYDSDLAALAALSSTGMITRTGSGTVSARTITGTANQITVTNGDGVSGNPTISLPSAVTIATSLTITGSTIMVGANTLTDSSGNIPIGRLNSGSSASASTFWCGDGTWKDPATTLNAVVTGSMMWWPGTSAPTGYLARDGSAVSRTTYAALFDVLVTQPGFTGQTFTITIATPGVVTKSSHGFTGGERLRLTTTGALPTGLSAGSEYFVIYVDANTFRLASTEANYAAGTAINTTGSQSGTHTYTRSLYGLGDGSTTFNLPDDRDVFIRGKAASGRALGGYQADAMQGHYHYLHYDSTDTATTQTVNNLAPGTGWIAGGTPGTGGSIWSVNGARTDGTNGTPRTASESRPVNRAYLPIIKY